MKIYNKVKKASGLKVIICLIFLVTIFYEASLGSTLWKNSSEFQKEVQSQMFSPLEGKNVVKLSFMQVLKQKTSYNNNILRRYKKITIIAQTGLSTLSLWIFFILSVRFPNSEIKGVIWKYVQALSGKRAPPVLF